MARVRYCYWREGWKALTRIVKLLGLDHVNTCSVSVVVSNSSSAAVARIWGLQRIFQEGFNLNPLYVVEIVWPRFSRLNCRQRLEALVHELAHIPFSFSGGLASHNESFRRRLREYKRRLRQIPWEILSELCKLLQGPPLEDPGACRGRPCEH